MQKGSPSSQVLFFKCWPGQRSKAYHTQPPRIGLGINSQLSDSCLDCVQKWSPNQTNLRSKTESFQLLLSYSGGAQSPIVWIAIGLAWPWSRAPQRGAMRSYAKLLGTPTSECQSSKRSRATYKFVASTSAFSLVAQLVTGSGEAWSHFKTLEWGWFFHLLTIILSLIWSIHDLKT